jgi:hypothetical protein
MKAGWLLCLIAAVFVSSGCVEIHNILGSGPPRAEPEDPYADFPLLDPDDDGGDATDDSESPDDDGPSPDNGDDEGNNNDDDDPARDDDDDEDGGLPPLPDGARAHTTSSGLEYYEIEVGDGDSPRDTSVVLLSYVGYLEDGTIFDSNDNFSFNLAGSIAGFREGVATMRVGGKSRLIIPSDLGYGDSGNPRAGIEGGATIIFDVTLHDIEEF